MATNTVQGKLMGVTIGGEWADCQTDATLTITKTLTTPDPCKPAPGESSSAGGWDMPTVETKNYELSFSAKTFAETSGFSLAEVTAQFLTSDEPVEWVFQTNDELTDYNHPTTLVYSGEGLLSSLTVNAPSAGESTYDTTITGYGEPSFEKVPVTT